MQTIPKDFFCGMPVHCILRKDRSTRKTEYLGIVKELHKEELYDMVDYEREVAGDELDKTLQKIKDSGMEVNEVDKEAFKEAVAPVYDKYADKYGDLFKKIEAAKEEK